MFCPPHAEDAPPFPGTFKGIWNALPQTQIFKCPDVEIFYQELHRYLGYEAAERLLEEEKEFLIAHGDLRQQAEWKVFKKPSDWLALASPENARSAAASR